MNFTLLSSIMTVLSMVVFIGILLWAFNSKNKSRFEEIGRIPLDDEDKILNEQNAKNNNQNKDGQ